MPFGLDFNEDKIGSEDDGDHGSDEDESEEDEEEPLIIQLMESMFTRKKTVQESEQMISQISVDDIRQEIRRLALRERCRLQSIQREKRDDKRMRDCEKLNELIQLENPQFTESVFEKPALSTRENPFYKALKAQKKERERYSAMLQLALTQTEWREPTSEQELPDAGTDESKGIFLHTFVDVKEKEKPAKEANQTLSRLTESRSNDIFYFYNFSFELPSDCYKQLGDFSVVSRVQQARLREFICNQWPVVSSLIDVLTFYCVAQNEESAVQGGIRCRP